MSPSKGQGLGFVENLVQITPEGGIAIRLTNKTGAPSVKGTVVEASTGTDNAFELAGVNAVDPIGVVYESGIADAALCWVVVAGIAEVLIVDGQTITRHNWVKVDAAVAGRADGTASPPTTPGSWANVEEHFREIGHALESKGAGTDVLAKIVLHWN